MQMKLWIKKIPVSLKGSDVFVALIGCHVVHLLTMNGVFLLCVCVFRARARSHSLPRFSEFTFGTLQLQSV